jgi:transposase-like protein
MARPSRYPRERAVRLVLAHRDEYDSEWDAMRQIADKLGTGPTETLRKWVRQAEADHGVRPGVLTDEATRIRELPSWSCRPRSDRAGKKIVPARTFRSMPSSTILSW